ncbi:EF-hand domain-containing protein [Rubrimonas cliftonensis]|uniref:Ca2+-binding protein, EF-hand superfamily n=1 Tax=Rubrimonas cliftonensis TaxID=89524 RepID=A0A1H4BZF5_9RHOB|nr:EF-hand domain-containing protein [Rubrimonas cliftonensis]SEA53447.1 Ca2+-binding protein, EF-hand superfamily [Rubrimonas cliftonensis]
MRNTTLAAALGCLSLVAGAVALPAAGAGAGAGGSGDRAEAWRLDRMFERLDADGDGRLVRDEIAAFGARVMEADADGDGRVTREEFAAARGERRAQARFGRLDADGDGAISREEFLANAAREAAREEADVDRPRSRGGDGGRAEQGERREGRDWRADARHRGDRRCGMERGRGAGLGFDRIDADGDGAIDAAEASAAGERMAERMMARLDADGDGAVTRDEARRARRKDG